MLWIGRIRALTATIPGALLAGIALLACHRIAAAASPLADAIMQQDTAQVQALLREHADVNAAQPDGSTPLHWAADHGDAATTALLLKAGAHPNVTTDTGMTPL